MTPLTDRRTRLYVVIDRRKQIRSISIGNVKGFHPTANGGS
jgi:hypothetical protein